MINSILNNMRMCTSIPNYIISIDQLDIKLKCTHSFCTVTNNYKSKHFKKSKTEKKIKENSLKDGFRMP